jgi:hypothetical protein
MTHNCQWCSMNRWVPSYSLSITWHNCVVVGLALGVVAALGMGCSRSVDVQAPSPGVLPPLLAIKQCDRLLVVDSSSHDRNMVGTVVSDPDVLKTLSHSLETSAGPASDITGQGIATPRWVEFRLESKGRVIGTYVLYDGGFELGYRDNGKEMMMSLSDLAFIDIIARNGTRRDDSAIDK